MYSRCTKTYRNPPTHTCLFTDFRCTLRAHTHTHTHTPFHSCCIPCFICSLLFITLHFTPASLEQIKGCLLLDAGAYSTPKSLNGIWLFSEGNMKSNIWQCWPEKMLIEASPEARLLLLSSHKPPTPIILIYFFSIFCMKFRMKVTFCHF